MGASNNFGVAQAADQQMKANVSERLSSIFMGASNNFGVAQAADQQMKANVSERLSSIAEYAFQLRGHSAMAMERLAGPSAQNAEKPKEPHCVMAHLETIESVLAEALGNLNRVNSLI